MESTILQIILYAATAFIGALITRLFDRHRAKREDKHLDKENDAQDITNIDAAVNTWQKVVNALEEQVSRLLQQRQEDCRHIEKLTREVSDLRQQVQGLQSRLASQTEYQRKIERYEKLLTERGIAY